MTREPRVLIVSASIGSGHTQAAFAIEEQIRQQYPQAHVDIVDFFTYDGGSTWGSFIKETYLKMLHIFPNMYDFLYRWTSGRGDRVKNLLAYSSKKRMRILQQEYQPDIIVCTHPFPCAAAAYLRRKGELDVPLVAVVTDFSVHPLWIYEEVNKYCIADYALQPQLLDKGIPRHHILPVGIPLKSCFAQSTTNEALMQKLSFNQHDPIIMVMGGGLGLGPLESVMENLERFMNKLQVIVVTGHNKEIIPVLEGKAKLSRHDIRILGFSSEIDSLMEIAHLLITKPGGLTASEALAKQLPMLLVPAIPGQEEDNARFLVRQGTAVRVRDITAIPLYLRRFLIKKPELLTAAKQAAGRLAKPDAACHIAEVILRLAKHFASQRIAR